MLFHLSVKFHKGVLLDSIQVHTLMSKFSGFFLLLVFWIVMMLEYFSPGKPLEPGSCVVISTGIHGIIYKCHLPKTFCTHACKPHIVRPQPPPITVGTVFIVAVLARLIKNAGLYLSQTNLSYEFIWFEIRMCFQYSSGFFSWFLFFFFSKVNLRVLCQTPTLCNVLGAVTEMQIPTDNPCAKAFFHCFAELNIVQVVYRLGCHFAM